LKAIGFGLVLAFCWLGSCATASAQIEMPQSEEETPLGQNVEGFLWVALGAVYVPQLNQTTETDKLNFHYLASREYARVPGVSAHLALIPVWRDNGLGVEGGYELFAVSWKNRVTDITNTYTGTSDLALSFLSLSLNYYRYFLSGADRLYLLFGGGYVWESASLSTETGGESKTNSASFPNWRLNTGFGYLHQMNTGAIGVELRADLPLLDSELDLEDPYGPFIMTLQHPVITRLCVILAIGRLK